MNRIKLLIIGVDAKSYISHLHKSQSTIIRKGKKRKKMYQQQQQYAYGGYAAAPPAMQAPYPQYPYQSSNWSTGLCDCAADSSSCCLTCFCPCVTFGRVAEIVDQGRTTCCTHAIVYSLLWAIGVGCLYSCQYRTKLRTQYNLPAEPCGDCCVHFCCDCCALSQEHRELKHRGLNPSAGWVNPAMTPPTPYQGMYK